MQSFGFFLAESVSVSVGPVSKLIKVLRTESLLWFDETYLSQSCVWPTPETVSEFKDHRLALKVTEALVSLYSQHCFECWIYAAWKKSGRRFSWNKFTVSPSEERDSISVLPNLRKIVQDSHLTQNFNLLYQLPIQWVVVQKVASIIKLGTFRVLLATQVCQKFYLKSHKNKTQGRDLDDQAKHTLEFYLICRDIYLRISFLLHFIC